MKNQLIATIKAWIGITLMNYTYALVQISGKNSVGRFFCECHRFFLNLLNISFWPVESADSYKSKYNSCDIIPIKTNRKGYVAEPAFNVDETKPILEERSLPDLNLYWFRDVMIQGDSDMVVDKQNHCVINDFCYNLDVHIKFVDGLLYQIKSNICILRSNLKHTSRKLSSGIMISGKFSKNYYHETLENLIKLTLLDNLNIPDDVPLIVDDSVKKIPAFSFILSTLTNNSKREIIYINPKEIVSFDELYTISYVNKISPHLIGRPVSKEDFVFDVDIIMRLREYLLFYKTETNVSRKIFLTRKNTNHRNFNEEEIFKLIEPLGFVAVAPEEYSFQEQISLFNQADFIIGGTGAAFTNLIFANNGCKVICIRPNVGGKPSVFTVLANMNLCELLYYHSDEQRGNKSIHSNYYVDSKKFIKLLMNFLKHEG